MARTVLSNFGIVMVRVDVFAVVLYGILKNVNVEVKKAIKSKPKYSLSQAQILSVLVYSRRVSHLLSSSTRKTIYLLPILLTIRLYEDDMI